MKSDEAIKGSFTLSEKDGQKLKGEFENKKISGSYLSIISKFFELMIKISAFLAIALAVYGFEYQKGMIESIGLDNIDVNYEIKEIYHFAFMGLIEFTSRVINISSIPSILDVLFFTIIFLVLGLVINFHSYYSLFKRKNSSQKEKEPHKWSLSNFFSWLLLSSRLSIIVWGGIGLIVAFAQQSSFKLIALLLFGFFAAPSYVGYINGFNSIEKLKSEPLCNEPEFNREYFQNTNLCSMVTIKGKALWGDIVLFTNDAYFIQKEFYFAYISKNGENCAFSYYPSPFNASRKGEKIKLEIDPEIKAICKIPLL
ncbi:hypothetical protein OFY17_08590 [Marinomonas sp. C2222]|uniref:Uncharacterized protein n=1 Tax=Marinomonas sargassi TaxID=2984494 RepID=A0ABT2YSS8_9GAMM|nr:hypothetical protein [Marinomonas sargassi]MCV2402936.1 hypothetical protein [Marinomonas sargassi]